MLGDFVAPARMQRPHRSGVADAAPEIGQRLARAAPAAFRPAIGEDHGVHGPRAGRADAVDHDALVLGQPIAYAPGEGAMGAAALQSKVDGFQTGRRFGGRGLFGSDSSARSVPVVASSVSVTVLA